MADVTLTVNGRRETVAAGPGDRLLEVLRHDLGLTGSKYGCGEGQCGACTVLMEGRVTARDGRVATYGDLVKGQDLRGAIAAAGPSPRAGWVVRGTPLPKIVARVFVTGAHRFTADLVRPGMLHGQVIRPAGFGAVLDSVDLSAARAMDGVVVVHDDTFIAVAAPSPRAAARAAAAVRASWRVPDAQPSSSTLFDVLRRGTAEGTGRGLASPTVVGDIAEGRRLATRTFARTFHVPYIAHVPLEPRAAVAEWSLTTSRIRR